MFRNASSRVRVRRLVKLIAPAAVLTQLIPFACGRNILHLVSPILLDETHNFLDGFVSLVAPLVLP